jgi:FtsZ-binding cell division protein ZapB
MVQHVEDLQRLVSDLQHANDGLRVDVRSLQSIREDLEREVIHLRNERDFFQRSTISMSTQLRTTGKLIADTLKLAEQHQPAEQPIAPSLIDEKDHDDAR